MDKLLLGVLISLSIVSSQAQKVKSYTIDTHFFPKDAQMWGYVVSEKSFMRASSEVEFLTIDVDQIDFYLHGELKIDSIISNKTQIQFSSEKVIYEEDYSYVGLKTSITSPNEIHNNTLTIYYSGFMNSSKARSLSDYMQINQEEGVFLRGYYYSLWFPVFQEPDDDDYEVNFKQIRVKLPKKYKTIIVGELLSETVQDEFSIASWKPGKIRMSDIQCTANKFNVMSQDNIFTYYVEDCENSKKIIDFTQSLKKLCLSTFRKVQDSSPLYIVEMPKYGNISSHNVIGISSDLFEKFNTDLQSKLTIAHELVHPYVAIPTSKENEFAALVKEGFPSYFHLYALKKISKKTEDFDLKKYMKRVEKSYIIKKRTQKDRRGNILPPEKPILKIKFDEIGEYKDVFILSDRVRLFLYHLFCEMRETNYDDFLKELFLIDSMNYEKFETLITKYLPNYEDNLNLWLNTNDFPETLHIK